jgi:succinate-semialdehyde dehydrogenase / glutarate-semialdehyde dehydrogenase
MTETISAAPGLARADLFRAQTLIDGAWVDSDSGETIPVTNPANGEGVGHVPNMSAEETRRAIEAAERALPEWRGRPAKERALILRRWADLMRENVEDLALLLTLEQGKPLAESRTEID